MNDYLELVLKIDSCRCHVTVIETTLCFFYPHQVSQFVIQLHSEGGNYRNNKEEKMKNVIQLVSHSNSLSVEGLHSLNPKVELGEKVLGRHRVSFKVAVVNDEL